MKETHKVLFDSYKIGKLTMKNRFYMSAMASLCEVDEDMCYTDSTVNYYAERAKGGVGMIITGANWVENESEQHTGCSFPCPTKFPSKYARKIVELRDRCHAFDTKLIIQLTAGLGRVGSPGNVAGDYVAPSEVTNRWDPREVCRPLTTEEVEHIVKRFGQAAKIVQSAGVDGIEIHAVHEGYLLDAFSMSLFNQRTDKYGGDLNARLRFAIEIVEEIKKQCGKDFPIIMRFSIKSYIKEIRQGGLPGEEFEELGRDVEEAIEAMKILEEAGVDAFDVDAGSYDSWYWAHPPMYFGKGVYVSVAEQVKDVVKVPIMMAGRMDDPDMAAKCVEEGTTNFVGLGRPLLADPEYVRKLQRGETEYIRPCLGCHDGCFVRYFEGGTGSCAVNPEAARELKVGITKADELKNVVVIGGGPAGLEAARVSAIRGHNVTLFEARSELGGALLIAGQPKFKEDDLELAKYYTNELARLGVTVHLNTKATEADIAKLHPDYVYMATGSNPSKPPIKGIDHTIFAQDVLTGKIEAEKEIIIIGGGLVGCELALHLVQNGHKVSIVEALKDILSSGAFIAPMNHMMLYDLLKFNNVVLHTGARIQEIEEKGVTYTKDDEVVTIHADQVILAAGYTSDNTLYEEIKHNYEVYNLGDSLQVGNVRKAVWAAYEVARNR
ncbi:MAG: FAD-dependent oxidoreductase [Eubacteriales bacterium]